MAADIDELQIKIAADSQSASENVLALAGSLETLSVAALKATNPLAEFSKALGSLKGFRTTNISKSADDIANAFGKIGQIGGVESSVELLDSVENLNEAISGLRGISESIKGLKVNKSFETNLDALSDAIKRLNLIGDTSAFASGVTAVESAIERLNNIEVGQGFINLVQASSQWSDALSKMNDIKLDTNFAEGIARVARATEILNEVDFGGFKRMNEALASLPENVRVSFGASSTEVKELTEHLVNLNNTVQSIQDSMPKRRAKTETTDLSESGNAATSLEETASAIDDLTDAAERGSEPVNRFKINLDGIGKGAMKAASAGMKALLAPVTAIGRKFKAASEKAGQFLASIKRIAMYRAVRSILKAITEGFEEGRKNLYYYSQAMGTDFAPSMDKAATAALYLKNSIGAATAPLTNLLVPIIDKAVDRIVELINKFNELTAVLTGASTWTKAVKYPTTWQESLDDADKSAKKLKSTMLGFDELNVIEIAEPASKKSGFDADDYIKMFEEVKTDMSVGDKIPELLMPVKLAWDSQGDKTLKTIKDTWNEILALIGAVGESVRKVWTNGTGQKSLELILQIVQNIVGTFGELAKGIRKAWEENENGTRITQAVWNVANNLLTVFRDIWGSIREWASGLDWSPLMDAVAGLGEAFERLTDPNSALAKIVKGAVDKFFLPIGTWLIEKGLPSAVNLLAVSFDTLGAALELLEPALSAVADVLGKIAGFTFSNITGLVDGFTGIIGTFFGKDVSNEVVKSVQDSADNLIETFGGDDSFYGKLSKEIDKVGSHGMYDFLNETMPNIGVKASEFFHGTEDQKGIFGQIGDLFKQEYENAMSETDMEIIPEQNVASFNKSVATISAGYKQIGDSASEAYETTADTKSVANMTSGVSSFKESYKTMLDDWASGVTSMSHGWDDFTYSVKEEWKMFNNDWASGMTSMSNGWNRFTDGIKEKWQTFKDDWASGMTGISTKFSNMWDETKTAFANAVDEIKNKTNEMWNDITSFFENGWLKISGGVNSFVETCSEGWMTFEESISDMWEELESDFEEGWEYIVEGVDNFKRAFSSSLSTIKMNVKSAWSTISSTLSSKWEDFKGFISDYRNNWKTGFNEIKTNVSNAWSNIRDEIGSVIAWQDLKQTVSDYAGNWFDKLNQIRTSVKDTFDKIYSNIANSKVGQAISDIASNIKETIGGIWGDEASGIKGTFVKISNGLKDFIGDLFNGEHLGGIGDKLKGTLNNVIDAFETAVNYIIKGLNYFIENANDALDIHVDIPSWVPGIGGSKFEGFAIPEIPEFTFYKFANGGFPDKGSLFLANEPGNPEMVGKIGGQTAVANNTQIVQAVSKGVYDAVVSAMAQASRTESGKTELHVYLDRQEITAQIEQQQRDNGVGIMGGLVYT